MPTDVPATELLPRPDTGRVFTLPMKVRLGDVDRNGRLRLDATARFLQDVATDDANDAELDRRYGWLVRRTMIATSTSAGIGESIEVSTWCAAIGRAWAERRSQIVGARGALIDAVSLWVQIDLATGRPARVADDFLTVYGEAANGRSVSGRLSLSGPEVGVSGPMATPWSVRRTDLDPFGHVNNAATWSLVEEAARLDLGDRIGVAELEYPQSIEPDVPISVATSAADGATSLWVTRSDGTVLAAGRWAPVSAT
ncbi:MAG: acyl-ACP thioesterase domain-containing protein [Ilumatobacter sp.]|uniref:acyl-[acyl-carrier-protein] thioesterase n=1 Tax=Ilumatobacter sp. TaxID=1967498 RepID=UPI003C733EDD